MSILFAWHSRCILRYNVCSLSHVVCNHFSATHSPKKLAYNKHNFLMPSRNFSWDGFYYSISSSQPVLTLQNTLLDLHNFSGFPWWVVIMLTTLGIRSIIVFPLAVHQNQVIARLGNLNAELGKMVPQLNKEVNIAAKMYGWEESLAKKVFKKNMREYYQKFILRDNCHPFKIVLLALFQIPVWICFSISLRNITINPSVEHLDIQLLQQQLKSEGTLWFTDLTLPDVYFIPILIAVTNLALIEIHNLRQIGKGTKLQKTLLYAMRLIVVAVAGAASLNPASVTFYWLCSCTFGLVQSFMLMSPRCRRVLRIPHTANESLTPFKDIALNFKKKFLS